MKTTNYLLVLSTVLFFLTACSDEWNSHYGKKEQIVNNEHVAIVNEKVIEFIEGDESLSSMYRLFNETGVVDVMEGMTQLRTILVVNDSVNVNIVEDFKEYMAKTHIATVALSPANLYDGQRILMWNGKYLTVTKEETEDGNYNIYFNGVKVNRIIKASDGYVYEIADYINSPQSLYEIIKGLGDNYSVFREMVLSKGERIFDKKASIPIGVDGTGNTVYDSIFTETFPYFGSKGFDLLSESLTATMLIPSNAVVEQALGTAKNNLESWGLTREDSIVQNWVFQSCFFNKIYEKTDFESDADLTSVFGKQWRNSVQQVNTDDRISMSNGVAYYVNFMKIPTNVLIYRLKDFFKWYEFLSDTQKATYFASENLIFKEVKTEVTAWSGWPQGGFPTIENRVLRYDLAKDPADTTKRVQEFTLDFVPFHCDDNGDGSYNIRPYIIPPGEYDLCLGFVQIKTGSPGDIGVYFNDVEMKTVTASDIASTTFHYDRGGQGYPEGYDVNKATDKKKSNYDRDGGKVGVVTITESAQVRITFHGVKNEKGNQAFHHWCLKPTKDCY